jgi:hypothetical protein
VSPILLASLACLDVALEQTLALLVQQLVLEQRKELAELTVDAFELS